jgi:hypothetical protein
MCTQRRDTAAVRGNTETVPADPDCPYLVTVERRGLSPLRTQLLVRAPTHQAAGELASSIAERTRGGMFEPTKVRRAANRVSALPPEAYDDDL